MAGRGGPLGPYFRATPVPRNSKLRLSMRFRFKKGAFWISWDLPWGGLWEVVSISKSQLLMQNSIWPTGVAHQVWTRGAPRPTTPCEFFPLWNHSALKVFSGFGVAELKGRGSLSLVSLVGAPSLCEGPLCEGLFAM